MDGGNFTVIEGMRVNGPARPAAAPASAPQGAASAQQRIDAGVQRARDADARLILETELKSAEARHQELQKEYNNGEPERLGNERNYQKYLDRVAELKAAIARNEADIAGIRRELSRQTSTR
jgi:predicted lipid-binding transport protein (Tim44 family)